MNFFSLYLRVQSLDLTRLEEENCHLAQVEVDKVLGFMSNIASKIPSNNSMPCWVVLFVELLLDECCNVFLDVVFFQGLCGAVYCVLLHLLGHVSILDHCFP